MERSLASSSRSVSATCTKLALSSRTGTPAPVSSCRSFWSRKFERAGEPRRISMVWGPKFTDPRGVVKATARLVFRRGEKASGGPFFREIQPCAFIPEKAVDRGAGLAEMSAD